MSQTTHKILVAVYGSLKKGFHNDVYLERANSFVGSGTISGFEMYGLGGFPMVVPGDGRISVEVYSVSDDVLESLDRLEGFPHFYDRKRAVVTYDNSGRQEKVWIYFGRPDQVKGSKKVADGIWTNPYEFQFAM